MSKCPSFRAERKLIQKVHIEFHEIVYSLLIHVVV
jgi:hypothetical protein